MQYKRKLRTTARVAQIWTVYRNFSINTRESPVRYATARQQLFHGEATDKIRGSRFATVDNKRPSAHPEGEFLPFKSNPSRNSIPHEKSKITKSMAETMQRVEQKFFFFDIPVLFSQFRYFRKLPRSEAFPICYEAADSTEYWLNFGWTYQGVSAVKELFSILQSHFSKKRMDPP